MLPSTPRSAFVDRYGPWAVVAGASEGIGEEFSLQLARRGLHVVMIARRTDVLERTAQNIRAATGAHLTPEQRDRILIGLNQYPNLSEKYVSVSPFGDLVSEKKTTSWREL